MKKRIFLLPGIAAALLLTACSQTPSAPAATTIATTAATTTTATTAATTTTAAEEENDVINIKTLGAAADGVTDDTEIFKEAFALAKEQDGGTIYVPAGTYKVTKRLNIKADNVTLCGDGTDSKIIYYCDQTKKGNDRIAKSLLFVTGAKNFICRDLYLEMQGEYFPEFGESYHGDACGICVFSSHNVLVENIEVTGFNSTGITVTGLDDNRSTDVTVQNSYFHHNRVAGVLYGWVDGMLITGCKMEYMGSVLDGGTGYGCAGHSGAIPRNVDVIGNEANYNYRKGLDVHGGMDILMEDNVCIGNRLYGIYAEGPNTTRITIRNNRIINMHKDDLDIEEPYTWIEGIAVGAASADPEISYDYIIENNVVENFGLGDGNAYGINVYRSSGRRKGEIIIRGNKVSGTDITHLLNCGGSAAGTAETDLRFVIEDNIFEADKMDGIPFRLTEYNSMIFRNNTISVGSCSANAPLIEVTHGETDCTAEISGNTLTIPDGMKVITAPDTDSCIVESNTVNGAEV